MKFIIYPYTVLKRWSHYIRHKSPGVRRGKFCQIIGTALPFIPYILMVSLLLLSILYWIAQPRINTENQIAGTKMKIQVVDSQVIIDPKAIIAQGGDLLVIKTRKNDGFFVDGEYEAGAHPPYSQKVFLMLVTPDGKYRLSDRKTGIKIKTGGRIGFKIGTEKNGEYRIWSGQHLDAERLSQFEKSPIHLSVSRVKTFMPNTQLAKKMVPKKKIKALNIKVRKKQTEALEKSAESVKKSAQKMMDALINREMEVTPK